MDREEEPVHSTVRSGTSPVQQSNKVEAVQSLGPPLRYAKAATGGSFIHSSLLLRRAPTRAPSRLRPGPGLTTLSRTIITVSSRAPSQTNPIRQPGST